MERWIKVRLVSDEVGVVDNGQVSEEVRQVSGEAGSGEVGYSQATSSICKDAEYLDGNRGATGYGSFHRFTIDTIYDQIA